MTYDKHILSQRAKGIESIPSASEVPVQRGRVGAILYRQPADGENTVVIHEYKMKTGKALKTELEDALWQIYQKDHLSAILEDSRYNLGNPVSSTIEVRGIVFYQVHQPRWAVAARYHRFSIENAKILRNWFVEILDEYAVNNHILEADKKKINLREAVGDILGMTQYGCKIDAVLKRIFSNANSETGEISLGEVKPIKDSEVGVLRKRRNQPTRKKKKQK